MTETRVLDKVRKLLKLAGNNSNAEEAAAAAAKAQQLIDEHKLSAALLELDTPSQAEPDEPIEDFGKKGAALFTHSWVPRWKASLAVVLARANGAMVYKSGNSLQLIGRASDCDTVRYLFSYIEHEIERLTDVNGRGCGTTWRNNFQLGCVDTISARLKEQREAFKRDQRRQAANPHALMRIEQGLAVIERKREEVVAWQKQNRKLYARSAGRSAYDGQARAAGREAGKSISLNASKGAIAASCRFPSPCVRRATPAFIPRGAGHGSTPTRC